MHKKFSIFILTFLMLFVINMMPVSANETAYTITNYQVKSTLNEDGTVDQTEIIQVHFNEPRHGIYRSIPETYDVGYGDGSLKMDHYTAKIENIHVDNDSYDVDSEDGYTTIQMGDEDKTITGDHTYTIHFTYVLPADYRDNTDIIYYSFLGSEWNTTIQHFSFQMKFEKPLTQHEVNAMHVYSGRYGNDVNDINMDYTLTKHKISGSAENITPYKAITLFGYVRQGYFHVETIPIIMPRVLGIAAVVLGLIVLYLEFFKKQKDTVEVIEFNPPDDLDSAQVGYIVDESADTKDLMSLIPYWANQGYISIDGLDEKTYVIKKFKDLPTNAPFYQKTFFNALFQGDEKERKMNHLPKKVVQALENAEYELGASFFKETQLFQWDKKACFLLALSTVCYVLMVVTMDGLGMLNGLLIAGMSLFFLIIVLIIGIMGAAKARFVSKGRNVVSLIVRILILQFGYFAYSVTLTGTEMRIPYYPYVFAILTILSLEVLCIRRLKVPTDYWLQIAGRLKGFKTFIQKAEIPQLEKLSKENPNYFFDVIPYAMVFDLSKSWCKRFENIPLEKPEWYNGHSYGFDSMMYYSTMNHAVTQPISSAVSQYSAKSSSSGGFSGGGGGGGGGGSW